jgi:hypothetical protein
MKLNELLENSVYSYTHNHKNPELSVTEETPYKDIDELNSYEFIKTFTTKSSNHQSRLLELLLNTSYPHKNICNLGLHNMNKLNMITEPVILRVSHSNRGFELKYIIVSLVNANAFNNVKFSKDYIMSNILIDSMIQGDPVFITKFIHQYFKDDTILMNKWLRYAKNIRELG